MLRPIEHLARLAFFYDHAFGHEYETVADIAGRLVLAEGTVRNYLSAAMAKVGARNRAEAVRIADERGWL